MCNTIYIYVYISIFTPVVVVMMFDHCIRRMPSSTYPQEQPFQRRASCVCAASEKPQPSSSSDSTSTDSSALLADIVLWGLYAALMGGWAVMLSVLHTHACGLYNIIPGAVDDDWHAAGLYIFQ